MIIRWKRMVLLLLGLMLVVGCASGGGELEIKDVWGRNSPMVAQNSAFYMTIVNNTGADEQLLSADVDVCGVVELHEMYMAADDVMGMREVPGGVIDIPAGATVELKVGGLHVMCIGKTAELNLGDQIPITLNFAQAGPKTITAEIRDEPPAGGMHNMGG